MRAIKVVRLCVMAALVAAGCIVNTPVARAVDLGLTPSHVYGLWLNINKTFLAHQSEVLQDQETLGRLQSMTPDEFSDKRPADVFARAQVVYGRLQRHYGLPAIASPPAWVGEYQRLQERPGRDDVTPSEVFLMSAQVLEHYVTLYVRQTDGAKPISALYEDYALSGKQPSDVYALVDLLDRRLGAVLARTGDAGRAQP